MKEGDRGPAGAGLWGPFQNPGRSAHPGLSRKPGVVGGAGPHWPRGRVGGGAGKRWGTSRVVPAPQAQVPLCS